MKSRTESIRILHLTAFENSVSEGLGGLSIGNYEMIINYSFQNGIGGGTSLIGWIYNVENIIELSVGGNSSGHYVVRFCNTIDNNSLRLQLINATGKSSISASLYRLP